MANTVGGNENLTVVEFFIHSQKNESESTKQGREIYDDYEAVKIRYAADKQTTHVAPAHEIFKRERNFQTGDVVSITYAMAWNDQYKKFKAGEAQIGSGTPLSEAPFLSQGKRLELKALSIHTLEALAALDGQPLKQLGMDGREYKNKAQAYLDNAKGSVDVVKMAATIATLEAKLAAMQGGAPDAQEASNEADVSASPFADWDAEDIKNWVKENGGSVPRGNASHATLVKAADDLNAELAKKKAAA